MTVELTEHTPVLELFQLNKALLQFWDEHGYIFPDVVEVKDCRNTEYVADNNICKALGHKVKLVWVNSVIQGMGVIQS